MVSPDSSHGVSRVVHHKDFYLRGGDMTVLVENHLYRIHSYFFARESLFFRQKFSTANSGDDSDRDRGLTDNNHYTLEDIKSEDFARFLWIFYNPKYSVYDAPLDTWLSILKLANRWTFDNVKELAVRELEKIEIEPVEKIAIYHDNTISRFYLIPSYVAVCKRDKHLSFTEGMKLGMETVLRVAEARERLRLQAAESGIRTPTFEDFEDGEVEVLIREIFNLGSRPTSPHPATNNGTNGAVNGTIKLEPAPPPKGQGAPASRANGGSATAPRNSSVDSMPPIATVFAQATAPAPAPTTTPTTASTATAITATATQRTAPQKPPTPTPPATVPQAAAADPVAQPPPPPPSTDKPKETAPKEPSSSFSLLSPVSGGVGEPLSSADAKAQAGSPDVLITKPVVSSSDHSNDVTLESKNNVNDAEKDESAKDPENTSGSQTPRGTKNNNKPRRAGRGK